jgi:hypothetical protein
MLTHTGFELECNVLVAEGTLEQPFLFHKSMAGKLRNPFHCKGNIAVAKNIITFLALPLQGFLHHLHFQRV